MARTRNATGASASTRNRTSARPQRATLARRSKPTKSLYVEDSDDATDPSDAADSDVSLLSDDDDDDEADPGIDRAMNDLGFEPPRRRPARPARQSPRKTNKSTRSRSSKATKPSSRGKQSASRTSKTTPKGVKRRRGTQLGSPSKKAKPSTKPDLLDPSNGVVPDWTGPAIPYSAWVDIFYYAATSGGVLDNSWLLHAATCCKAFSEPAVTALYQCPSPKTSIKAKKLASLLEQPSSALLFNYRAKIEALYVNIDVFPLGLLPQVIRPLFRLKELIIFTPFDQPPYRELDKTIRWNYPDELFNALLPSADSDIQPIALKSWEWSSRLLGGHVANVDDLSRIHQLASFAKLTRLSFTNFQVPSLHKTIKDNDDEAALKLFEEDGKVIESIAQSISQLACLRHLVFESSTVMNDRLLPLLPKNLVHLELINCWEVKSDDLTLFLRTHGRDMRSLTLNHNQSLDLAFLTDLAETCPNLRELRMNLSYFRHHESVDDADPMYDQALDPTQLPLWPSSLRLIEIEHVRQWTVEAAEMFLQSLVDSAPNLPNLRHLAIKTMLDVPWQTRAVMRQQWREKLEKVFLRPWDPPRVHTTLRPQEAVAPPSPSPAKKKKPEASPPSRRSGRIAAHASDSDHNSPHHLRNRGGKPLYRDPDTDEDEYSSGDDQNETENQSGDEQPSQEQPEKLHIQGMCKTVSILFDNQKVRELQYGMEDFNDDDTESSGEEWAGDQDEEDDPVFVWR